MQRAACESKLRTLVNHAWDQEVLWEEIEGWLNNFDGSFFDKDEEQLYGLFVLSKFMYFGRRLVREMLKALYRDHFESPLRQRIRRNFKDTRNSNIISAFYNQELASTRFVGVGNPAESGAHLLYYFRQVNYLKKDLFVDVASAFVPKIDKKSKKIVLQARDASVTRLVFFDDLVGSGTQACQYLSGLLNKIRESNPGLEIRFMSLFATTRGLARLNEKNLFNGRAMCLFELDDTYKAFDVSSRYFSNTPSWFDKNKMYSMTHGYGRKLWPNHPVGYKDGQLLIGFSHNTPDNVPPIFWGEAKPIPWAPVFFRYHKQP